MMALRAHARGGPEMLVYEEAPVPSPVPGELIIEVHAAGITFAEFSWDETWQREGRDRTPTVPSHEVSGVVTAVGPGVTRISVGDDVYGLVPFDRDGAAAEYVAVPADHVAPKPSSVSHPVAAALPLAALTAWQALHDHAKVQTGERVLVHGGAGGVGAFAVQLARLAGAAVTATAREKDAALVKQLGAGHVIAFEKVGFDELGLIFDVVIDTVGGSTLDRSFDVLARGGRLVTLQAPPSQRRADEYGVTATFFIVGPDPDALNSIAHSVDTGEIEVLVAGEYPLADGCKAFESARSPTRAPGKTVLVVRP